ncbi:hypothetical protein [Flavobacterium quisquiliarum]|uniref:Uncharacterized protein n=1 Tax=Flavobacterium quisquiliarum TaxID=1834436 RepID=A0ABV8W9H2_9FLAO|nr:hypothetical protein [Flavobacterium quisquiliarum]MBW1657840.1 hypothetical protein [Flavobacterium quisquiliarum]
MKTTAVFSKEKIYNLVFFSSIGFILGLVSFFLIKILSIILLVLLITVLWKKNNK